MDLEKTLAGLDCCTGTAVHLGHCPEGCPYWAESERADKCVEKLHYDALELLKALQAKLMTLEDIMEIYNARDCHVWPYDTAPYIFVEEHPDIRTYHGSWTAWREIMAILHDGIFVHTINTYGKTWRCWTFQPTDKQREETPWT